jgi:putative spermidine/putrescine transport system permease protein
VTGLVRKVAFGALLALVIVPLLVPIVFSFSEVWQGLLPQGFTLEWYRSILDQPQNYAALSVSLVVASSAVALDLAVVVPGAYAVNRMSGRAGGVARRMAMILPLLFPPIVVGNGLVQAFSEPPLALTGSVVMVVVAHGLIGFPFMFRNVLASLATIDERTLSEAASSLGASLWQRLRYVVLPNIGTGVLSGALIVFAISIGEFEVTSMVAGFSSQTLPLVLFQWFRNDMRVASAISAFLVYVSLASFGLMTLLTWRWRRRVDAAGG